MLARSFLLSVSAALVAGAAAWAQPAVAQPPPYAPSPVPYVAQPPTKGALYTDGQTGRYLLGGTWLYRADPGNLGLAQSWWRGSSTSAWSPVAVPGAFNAADFSTASMAGSVGWYRRDFTLPSKAMARYVRASERHWIVRFESVNYIATVWLNGHRVGSHLGENLPFEFDLTPVVHGVNRLVVRVDSRIRSGQQPPGPGSGWWNFGGILREVYLRAVQRADISQVTVRPLLPCPACAATIEEQVLVRNVTGVAQSVQLHGVYGRAKLDFGAAKIGPHGTWAAQASVRIVHPNLWSIDHPALYRATLTLSDAKGRRLGGYVTDSGIRSITVTPDGRLLLNGRRLNLRGAEVREQTLQSGYALSPANLKQLVSWVKQLGATVIRADPLSPQIMQMADRAGILVWSDITVNQQVRNTNMQDPAWVAYAHSLLREDILANENHPSAMLWSIGNELPTPAPAAERSYIAGAAALARQLDPTRPVGMSISDYPGLACQRAYAPLDVIGFNDYFGWFDVGGGATADRVGLSPFLDTFRTCYPSKALFVSEFGFDANRDGPVEERGTYQFQADSAAYHLGVFATKPWLSGAIYFLLQDAAVFPHYGGGNPFPNPPFNAKGLIDESGNFKPAFGVVASSYRNTVQIAP